MNTSSALSTPMPDDGHQSIAAWLLACCALVAAIVVIGGATRLTGSGLSIVVWEPIMGIIPPLSERAWLEAFEQYRQFPQYQQINAGMTLQEFKFIFWWEYWHRVVGRLIGFVFFIGFVYFLATRRLGRSLTLKLSGLLVLGGLQGAMGWYMVASGLVDVPHVSQYRLTAHLSLALVIYGLMLWLALDLLRPRNAASGTIAAQWLRRGAWLLFAMICVTILSGGFVAGTRAGFFFNTFPLMNGQWIPGGMWTQTPLLRNLFENPVTIQFFHRVLAIATFTAIVAYWVRAQRAPLAPQRRMATHLLLAAGVLQVTLGISTLLLQVPITLAVAHQGGAVVLLTAVLYALHTLYRPVVQPQAASTPATDALGPDLHSA